MEENYTREWKVVREIPEGIILLYTPIDVGCFYTEIGDGLALGNLLHNPNNTHTIPISKIEELVKQGYLYLVEKTESHLVRGEN